ncbi:MAG: radical SAM protein [Bryobacteraceae bacterium]|jgi:MoaA/NifB/PqqE/SkfB family radical SAM enzyme
MDAVHQDPRNSIVGWWFTASEIAEALSNGHMLNPSLDLSNPCNLNCPYCYIEEKDSTRKVRKPHELSHEETLAVIKDLQACGAKTINIVGAGEPTIDPHFKEVIEFIAQAGMKTVLFTNGIQLAHEPWLVGFLYRHNVSVVLKYNSDSEEIQDLVAGRSGYTKRRDQALEKLQAAGFAAHEPTRLGIDMIVFKGNVAEIPKIHERCRRENIFPIAAEYIPTGRTEAGQFRGERALLGLSEEQKNRVTRLLQPISAAERVELCAKLSEIDRAFGIERAHACAYFGGAICTQIIGLYIDIEGNIWPCVARKKWLGDTLSDGRLGNVRENDKPSVIWKNDPYMKLIRQNFTGGCPYKAPLVASLDRPDAERRV